MKLAGKKTEKEGNQSQLNDKGCQTFTCQAFLNYKYLQDLRILRSSMATLVLLSISDHMEEINLVKRAGSLQL